MQIKISIALTKKAEMLVQFSLVTFKNHNQNKDKDRMHQSYVAYKLTVSKMNKNNHLNLVIRICLILIIIVLKEEEAIRVKNNIYRKNRLKVVTIIVEEVPSICLVSLNFMKLGVQGSLNKLNKKINIKLKKTSRVITFKIIIIKLTTEPLDNHKNTKHKRKRNRTKPK